MEITRTFTREQLDTLGLPNDLPKERVLLDEIFDSRDWATVMRLVFRSPDDDQTYEIYYEAPPTEMQEGLDPWNDDLTVKATLVEQRVVFRTEWRPAHSPQRTDEVHMGINEAIYKGLKCAVCHSLIDYINAPTGGWWAHLVHPENGHDAVSLMWAQDAPPWVHEEGH